MTSCQSPRSRPALPTRAGQPSPDRHAAPLRGNAGRCHLSQHVSCSSRKGAHARYAAPSVAETFDWQYKQLVLAVFLHSLLYLVLLASSAPDAPLAKKANTPLSVEAGERSYEAAPGPTLSHGKTDDASASRARVAHGDVLRAWVPRRCFRASRPTGQTSCEWRPTIRVHLPRRRPPSHADDDEDA